MNTRNMKTLRTILVVTILITAVVCWTLITLHSLKCFDRGTIINGTNCSELTVSEAKQKIEEQNETLTFTFLSIDSNGEFLVKDYIQSTEYFELHIKEPEQLNIILAEQKAKLGLKEKIMIVPQMLQHFFIPNFDEKTTTVKLLMDVNEDKVAEFLNSVPELQSSNMVMPENAYVIQNDEGKLEIIPEKKGNFLNYNDALNYSIICIENGIGRIDFSAITRFKPEISSEDIIQNSNVEEINRYLSTVIHIKFSNGEELVLDKEIMKNWVVEQEGRYELNIDENLPLFLDLIEQKIQSIDTYITIVVGDEEQNIYVPYEYRPKFDREQEEVTIKGYILNGEGIVTIYPIFTSTGLMGNLQTYIALDINNQTVWAYDEGNEILKASCVTGNVSNGHATPTGIYFLSYKTKNTTLRGYNNDGSKYASYVNFWMPFNGGIGFHDASWRNGVFGGNIYMTNGSHGCVNMNYQDAETLYNFINEQIPIIVF